MANIAYMHNKIHRGFVAVFRTASNALAAAVVNIARLQLQTASRYVQLKASGWPALDSFMLGQSLRSRPSTVHRKLFYNSTSCVAAGCVRHGMSPPACKNRTSQLY